MAHVSCPQCGKRMPVAVGDSQRSAQCPDCGTSFGIKPKTRPDGVADNGAVTDEAPAPPTPLARRSWSVVICPKCEKRLAVALGESRLVKCPDCGASFAVKPKSQPADEPADPAAVPYDAPAETTSSARTVRRTRKRTDKGGVGRHGALIGFAAGAAAAVLIGLLAWLLTRPAGPRSADPKTGSGPPAAGSGRPGGGGPATVIVARARRPNYPTAASLLAAGEEGAPNPAAWRVTADPVTPAADLPSAFVNETDEATVVLFGRPESGLAALFGTGPEIGRASCR